MSQDHSKPSRLDAQQVFEIVSVSAEGRLHNNPESKVLGFVDLTLYFQPGGSLTVHGCGVLREDGKPPYVLLPGRKGERRTFPTVAATGEIRRVIDQAVLKEYERLKSAVE